MNCYITLADPNNFNKKIVLNFELFPTEIAYRWKQQVLLAQTKKYTIDDPCRFYGLKDKTLDVAESIDKINNLCDTINSHENIIERKLSDINDQDTLNYLHNVFERYHGLLDQQTHSFFVTAPKTVKEALANLNIQVHRLESLQRKNFPRFVITYFGLPKTEKLRQEDFAYMTNDYCFGGLYLNYVEIGKTLEELMKDNDSYIGDDAFKPWNYFSADCKVMLLDRSTIESRIERQECLQYYTKHKDFFESRGFKEYDPRLRPGAIHIGQLINKTEATLDTIRDHQFISSVDFS